MHGPSSQGLYHPVLLYRHQSKLTFPLYCSCVEANLDLPLMAMSSSCQHMEAQCTLTRGSRAAQLPSTTRPQNLALSCLAPPSQEREANVASYRAPEDIALDPTNITKNPGQHALPKLVLNAMWGKFTSLFLDFLDSDKRKCTKSNVCNVSAPTEERVETPYKQVPGDQLSFVPSTCSWWPSQHAIPV